MGFQDYLGIFMKLFLDNFKVFSALKTYRDKLWLCKKNDISLDMEKRNLEVLQRGPLADLT